MAITDNYNLLLMHYFETYNILMFIISVAPKQLSWTKNSSSSALWWSRSTASCIQAHHPAVAINIQHQSHILKDVTNNHLQSLKIQQIDALLHFVQRQGNLYSVIWRSSIRHELSISFPLTVSRIGWVHAVFVSVFAEAVMAMLLIAISHILRLDIIFMSSPSCINIWIHKISSINI